jgi:hypothetical protein
MRSAEAVSRPCATARTSPQAEQRETNAGARTPVGGQLKSPARPFYGKLPVSSLNIPRTVVSRCAAKFGIFSYCWSFTAATA